MPHSSRSRSNPQASFICYLGKYFYHCRRIIVKWIFIHILTLSPTQYMFRLCLLTHTRRKQTVIYYQTIKQKWTETNTRQIYQKVGNPWCKYWVGQRKSCLFGQRPKMGNVITSILQEACLSARPARFTISIVVLD